MINQEEVRHIAKLARLGLAEEEVGQFQKDLTAIFDMVEKLKEVDVTDIEPTEQVTGLENRTRSDEGEKKEVQIRKNILANAPETKDGYIKVKAILE